MKLISDILNYIIVIFINPSVKFKEFRATRQWDRGDISTEEAHKILYGKAAR